MKKPAYGLNDAPRVPRRWWNIVDKALRSYGLVPTRADRCTYVLYGRNKEHAKSRQIRNSGGTTAKDPHEAAIDYLLDPVSGNNAQGREVLGVVCLRVDDLCLSGGHEFKNKVIASLKKDFAVGSEDTNDIMFVGQRLQWKYKDDPNKGYISVNQKLAVEAVEEISFDKRPKMMSKSFLSSTLRTEVFLDRSTGFSHERRPTSAIGLADVPARLLSQPSEMFVN